MRGAALPRIPALDGVRGIAIAAVLLFHHGMLAGGFLGVDLFFVLSGFLITSLLVIEGGTAGRIDLARFWARRARRLFPALAGMLLGVALYGATLAPPGDLAQIRAEAWATMLYVPNWYAVFGERDYWALFRAPSPLQHTWSLGIEEQFYLVWPLGVAGLWAGFGRRTPRLVGIGSLLLATASAAWMWASYDPKDPSRAYYGTDTRAAAILLGGALAAWHLAWGPVRSRWARVLLEIAGLVGLVVLAVVWWRWDGDSPALYQGGFAACGAAGAAVIAASVHPQRGPLARGFAWPPLRGLGIVSYGVYLWHWPIYLVLDPARTGLPSVALLGVRVTATLLVALASYALVERPILRGALRWRQWAVIGPGATAAIVAAILAATAGPRAPRDSPIAAAPEIAPTGRVAARILILGDSLGVSLFSGLARAGAEPGLEFALGVKIGCERASTARDCPAPWPTQVAQQRPDAVLVIDSGSWSIYPLRTGSRVIPIGDASWDEAWVQQRQAIVDDLLAAGTQRVVFTTIPCIEPYWWQQREPRLAPENVARANANLATLAARNPERVRLIDLAEYVCPGNRYRRNLESVQNARVDGLHFSSEGAELVGRWLAPQLARAAGL